MEKHCWTRWRQAARSILSTRFKASTASLTPLTRNPVSSVFDDFAAGAQVHGDDRHSRGIGFRQDQAKTFRDGVQMKQRLARANNSFLPATSTGPI